MNERDVPSSFRDPSGAVFSRDGELYRRVNIAYRDHYDHLVNSGLYDALVNADLLVPHREVDLEVAAADEVYRTIKPEPIGFISYPYEWCFSQLQDAALATLKIQELALQHGMCLKDASTYNIQFRKGKPILIDTLSFEKYEPGRPWVAYRQFCQHFLAPLALMACTDVRLSQLLRIYIDGVPLDLASALLPWRTRLSPLLSVHLHVHARMQSRFGDKAIDATRRGLSPAGMRGLVDALRTSTRRLTWKPEGTVWADYYEDTSYAADASEDKRRLISEFVEAAAPRTVWDLGANVGLYSRIASDKGVPTVAFDMDPAAVERNYLQCRRSEETNLLPLVLDLTNPSSGIGWANEERLSLAARGPADLVLALALVHHLAIANNVPFAMMARFFHAITRWLVIEFVPKDDPQVQRLLRSREDVFADYDQGAFEREFAEHFTINSCQPIAASPRTLYLMRRREGSA
ncbi:MAG: SAM-dependent methyltransferase [Armatimonadota bacterium]|nr:MAG: SAM-dependent methyltransferase [Armatimonadota bacterium]